MKIDIAFIISGDNKELKNNDYIRTCTADFAEKLFKKKQLLPTMGRGFDLIGADGIGFLIPREMFQKLEEKGFFADKE